MNESSTYVDTPAAGHSGDRGDHGDYGTEREPAPDPRERRASAYDGPPRRDGRYQPPWWVRLIGTGLLVCLVLLLLAGVAGGALAVLPYTTPPASSSSGQEFAVAGAPTVIVHVNAGGVTVVTGANNHVSLRATKTVRALSSGLTEQALNAIHITATQSGNTITIEETAPSFDFWPSFWYRNVQIDLTVPAATNLAGTINAGSLSASNLHGSAQITTNAGSIEFDSSQLSDASLHSDAGSITLNGVTLSGNAILSTNAGSVDLQGALAPHTALDVGSNAGSISLILPKATSAHLEASANAGSISIAGWPITVQQMVARASASGDLSPNPTGSIVAHTNAGSITVTAG